MVNSLLQPTISRSANILHVFNQDSAGSMITLYQPGMVNPWDRTGTDRFYGYITDLRARIYIRSTPVIPLPDLSVGTSRTDRILAATNTEWNSPRKEMHFYLRNTHGGGWHEIGAISLQNISPYQTKNVLSVISDNVVFAVANDASLGARIIDANHGLLSNDDQVTIWGAVKEEVTTLPSEQLIQRQIENLDKEVREDSTVIMGPNPYRTGALIINSSTVPIYLNLGPLSALNKGILLYPNGGSYEINLTNMYQGIITAIATSGDDGTGNLPRLSGFEAT